MTVRIGEMTATFANANVVYTAVGMTVNDSGSSSLSSLMHLSVNANSRFVVYKSGETCINTDFEDNTANVILNIKNAGVDLITATPQTLTINTDTKSNSHFYVKSYSENAVDVGATNTFDLNQGSVFICNPTEFNQAYFIKPTTSFSYDQYQTFTCTVIVNGSQTGDNTAWQATDVIWASDIYPNPAGNVAVYNFMNVNFSNTWFGFIAGEDYRLPAYN